MVAELAQKRCGGEAGRPIADDGNVEICLRHESPPLILGTTLWD
jgi:hypothetical protein